MTIDNPAQFDRYASSYDEDLQRALSATGESREYYADARIRWSAQCIFKTGARCTKVLDFGCGDGANTTTLLHYFRPEQLVGVDASSGQIERARSTNNRSGAAFYTPAEFPVSADFDVAYCNGVFHHIPPPERQPALKYVMSTLRPGGWFAFWENNPWNPGTRYVMSNCAFDEDAITLSPVQATAMLRTAGFSIIRRDCLFYFPAGLKWLRPIERALIKLPLGGQYQILCQKPE